MKKPIELPFRRPTIFHTPRDTALLGILTLDPNSYDWLYSNFIDIYFNKITGIDNYYPKTIWEYCPFLYVFYLPYEYILTSYNNFSDFIETAISTGYYVCPLINRKFIKEYSVHDESDHNPFITGFNPLQRTITTYDFFEEGTYSKENISYSSVNEAFLELPRTKEFNEDYSGLQGRVFLIKYNNNANYQFNKKEVLTKLKSFLTSENLIIKNIYSVDIEKECSEDYVFGLECYNYLKNGWLLRRQLGLIYSKALFWKKRYIYFREKNYLKSNEKTVENIDCLINISREFLFLYMKYEIQGKKFSFERYEKMRKEIIDLERSIAEEFISDLY
ncbi:hypothetical protein KUA55_17630 [Enterococcus sp. ALS3]|uniref:Uncharacterized protein n=1 Tax=Enterococcus alishanensis TaxID=1303817 RepID=A0ABS6THQ5_9ENTE|nr:hypothetical protein [Enterococcus alishanensis]MBV7392478.1 hypothetical protein [Enterococcus alishanensis]